MDSQLSSFMFRGFSQLIGEEAFARISSSSVCVVGLGGVGSWAVEALARCGVRALTLVDLDEVCITNVNRQVQATSRSVGRPKADVLLERVLEIHPSCQVRAIKSFFSRSTASQVLDGGHNLVIDAIDRAENKALLIAECVARNLLLITTGSVGDRLCPSALEVADLARTIHDPLLQIVRKELRQQYGFPLGERRTFRIPCVYAPKQRNAPRGACDATRPRKSCNDGMGSAVFVTGAAGFFVASEATKLLSADRDQPLYPWHKKAYAEPAGHVGERENASRAVESQTEPENCAQPA